MAVRCDWGKGPFECGGVTTYQIFMNSEGRSQQSWDKRKLMMKDTIGSLVRLRQPSAVVERATAQTKR